ncbi:MAG: ferrochelatase [Nitrospirae bacterium]|nr:ferrochelatase [Nitrospirota bacterium]
MGVLLLNLGGPDSIQAVKPFLYNLFSDRQIIRLGPKFLQKPFAWLISTIRSKKTEGLYSLIGGKSPIFDITTAQAKALEKALNNELEVEESPPPIPPPRGGRVREGVAGVKVKVFVGMRYWHPFIEEVIPEIYNSGVRKLIALSLYPQYSLATSGSSISKLKEVVSKYKIKVFSIQSWYNHPLYIEALVDVIKKGFDSFTPALTLPPRGGGKGEGDIHVLFSAHSLPQKLIDEGDPYVEQIMGTINEITKRLDIKWDLSYQSKSGPVRWLEPSTDEKIKELAGKEVRNVLVVPISFVSDHIETLYEIDILYRQMADGYGINLRRTKPLNTHPVFIEALKDITMKSMKETEWGK